MQTLWAVLPEARIAGGAVRDFLAGVAVADVDFASPLAPDAVMARLRSAGIRAVPTGLAHGTVTAMIGGRGFEITTLRHDVETDGRHAVVAFTDDWQGDAARRDFTINAMSMDRGGTLYDYFDGVADLRAGRVRFVGDSPTRIKEDYLRILRFFRFFARYAKADADAAAVTAITALRAGVEGLSAERVWSEVKRILQADDPRAALGLMAQTGVLDLVLPASNVAALDRLCAHGAPVDALLRVAALLEGDAEAFALRFKLSGKEQESLKALQRPFGLAPHAGDDDLRRALADTAPATLVGQSWLAQDEQAGWDALRQRIAAMPRPVFPLQGRDLTATGLPPGPRIGEILTAVRGWWMAGGCIADATACLQQAMAISKGY